MATPRFEFRVQNNLKKNSFLETAQPTAQYTLFFLKVAGPFGRPCAMRSSLAESAWATSALPLFSHPSYITFLYTINSASGFCQHLSDTHARRLHGVIL